MRWFLAAIIAMAPGIAAAECDPDRIHLRGPQGTSAFTIELADDAAERSQGLMHRESLPMSAGMLFVYERPQAVNFWMENTLIPLDMIFIDSAGQVVKVHENAVPLDRTPILGGDNILAVLEINGGLAGTIGIGAGTEVRHPAMPQDLALWPCDE